MNYTPQQTRWWLAAIEQAELDAHRAGVIGARVAQAQAKDLQKYFREIQQGKGD